MLSFSFSKLNVRLIDLKLFKSDPSFKICFLHELSINVYPISHLSHEELFKQNKHLSIHGLQFPFSKKYPISHFLHDLVLNSQKEQFFGQVIHEE
jgi:hypothetical protein